MIITDHAGLPPRLRGHRHAARRRTASNRPMNTEAGCTEPAAESNARGAQNAPARRGRRTRAPVVASYDPETGRLDLGRPRPPRLEAAAGSVAPQSLGEESWKWLYLQPLTGAGSDDRRPPDARRRPRARALRRLRRSWWPARGAARSRRAGVARRPAWPRLGDAATPDVQAEREVVMSQAEQFMLRINTYGPDLPRRRTHDARLPRAGRAR